MSNFAAVKHVDYLMKLENTNKNVKCLLQRILLSSCWNLWEVVHGSWLPNSQKINLVMA